MFLIFCRSILGNLWTNFVDSGDSCRHPIKMINLKCNVWLIKWRVLCYCCHTIRTVPVFFVFVWPTPSVQFDWTLCQVVSLKFVNAFSGSNVEGNRSVPRVASNTSSPRGSCRAVKALVPPPLCFKVLNLFSTRVSLWESVGSKYSTTALHAPQPENFWCNLYWFVPIIQLHLLHNHRPASPSCTVRDLKFSLW